MTESDAPGPDPVPDTDPEPGASAFLRERDYDPGTLGSPGRPFDSRSPFNFGLYAGLGALLAFALGLVLVQISSILVLIVVAMFLAVGLNPVVEWLMRRGLRRSLAVLLVTIAVLVVVALFVFALAPVVSDQAVALTKNAPSWLDKLQHNSVVRDLDRKYEVISKLKHYITSGGLAKNVFGGVVGLGLAVLTFLGNAFVVITLTLYFLASLPTVKRGLFRLAPASRRDRVTRLGDRILASIGGYVSGATVVAFCAGLSTMIFLFIVGMGGYALALALVVAILDVIPMVGATLGAIIVSAIGFATSPTTGIACVIFYVVYQQVENYLIYPRVMSRSVDIPGALTIIAALVGASLLGVVGALLAIPTAASIMLLVNEIFVARQDAR